MHEKEKLYEKMAFGNSGEFIKKLAKYESNSHTKWSVHSIVRSD